jgi:hypothetical protein
MDPNGETAHFHRDCWNQARPGDGGPILYDEAFMPGDRLVISAERLSDDVTVSYELRRVGDGAMS